GPPACVTRSGRARAVGEGCKRAPPHAGAPLPHALVVDAAPTAQTGVTRATRLSGPAAQEAFVLLVDRVQGTCHPVAEAPPGVVTAPFAEGPARDASAEERAAGVRVTPEAQVVAELKRLIALGVTAGLPRTTALGTAPAVTRPEVRPARRARRHAGVTDAAAA